MRVALDGGDGSGNFEHKGRPGKRGGSGEGGGKAKKPIKEFLGEEFKGVKGQAAVEKLLKEKRGHVKAAFTRQDIGDINLVWGDEEGGLCHLINRRIKQGIDINSFLSDLAEVIEKGKIYPNKYYQSRIDVWHNGKLVILETAYDAGKINWVVTAFIQKNEPKR
ncbi:MAG: hypothetical protein Q4P84_00035 [Elusimicrobiales bacterium]|nr:hypothetical protein [Elusimicrobiales bacterium]